MRSYSVRAWIQNSQFSANIPYLTKSVPIIFSFQISSCKCMYFLSVLGSQNNSICAYNIEYGKTHEYSDAHRDAVSCLDWNKGILVTGSWDASVKVWKCNDINGFQVSCL